MRRKGDKIAEFTKVLKRQERKQNYNDVNQQVWIKDFDVEPKSRIIVDLSLYHTKEADIKTFEVKTYSREAGFTIPKNVVEELELLPGQTIKIVLFESAENDSFFLSDSTDVIGRSELNTKSTTSVSNRRASNFLEENDLNKLKFRNVETEKEVVSKTHSNYSKPGDKNRIHIPTKTYEELHGSPGDVIEICAPPDLETTSDTDEADAELSQEEKIEEIHGMVSEMYDAYLSAKDD